MNITIQRDELFDLAERLKNGLEWRISTHPTQCDESDDEMLVEANELLNKIQELKSKE